MNKIKLLAMSFIPIVLGYIMNLLILVPGIGVSLLYIMPIIILIYWYWVGLRFSENIRNPLLGIASGNFFGILSLCIYYWQFIILDDQKRSIFLAGLSQYFTTPLNILTAKISMLFDKSPSIIDHNNILNMHISGTIIMIITFVIGYIVGIRKNKNQH